MSTIPEGYVFVAKADGVAAALLNAADKIGADRKAGVRTVTGGYHVLEEIAREYGGGFADVEDEPDADDAATKATESPDDSWKVAEIEDYAQREGIDLAGAKNKAEKLARIHDKAEE